MNYLLAQRSPRKEYKVSASKIPATPSTKGIMNRTVGLVAATVFAAVAVGSAAPAIAAPPQAPYPNCTIAKQNGDCNIPSSSDKYQSKLDRDQDGLGCEC